MQQPNPPKRRSMRDQLKLSLPMQYLLASQQSNLGKENNHAVAKPRERSRPILIENHSCSPDHGDKTKRAKSRTNKQNHRIAIDRNEKQVKLAKRCEELILLTRNFVNSAGRVLKMFSESIRENDINLKIFLNQKLSLSDYLDDVDKQVSSLRSNDVDLSRENEVLRLENDRLIKALRKDGKQPTGKDARDRVYEELRKQELTKIKRFVRERMESEQVDFNRLLEFTEKEYRLKLIMLQKDSELTREKETQLNDLIRFVRDSCEEQILGKQHTHRGNVLSETTKSNNSEDRALMSKIKELLKYLKVEVAQGKPVNSMYLLETLEVKLYSMKIQLLPTIRRQNQAYSKEIKQLRAEIESISEENRRLSGSKANLVGLEEQVKSLREQLFKIDQVKEPQYFTNNQQHLRNSERERAELQKMNVQLQQQLSDLEKEKVRLEGIVNKVFEQLQTICVSNSLIKRQELRELNYQGLIDVLQRSIGDNKQSRDQRQRERRRSDSRAAELEKTVVALSKKLGTLEEEFEMILSQKLQLEEHMERTKATSYSQIEQLKSQLEQLVEKLKRFQERLVVTAQTQTQVDSTRWDDMQLLSEGLKETNLRQSRELTEKAMQLHVLECKYEGSLTNLDNCRQKVIHLNNCLSEARSEIQANSYRSQQLMMALNDKEQQYSQASELLDRATADLRQLITIKEQLETKLKEHDTNSRHQNELINELKGKEEILGAMLMERNGLVESLTMRMSQMEQEEKQAKREGNELQQELMETTIQIKELKEAFEQTQKQLSCKQSMLESFQLQAEELEHDSQTKSMELLALKELTLRSSQEVQGVSQQMETLERLEEEVGQLRQELEEKKEQVNKLKHQTIELTIMSEENSRLKKEVEAQEAMVKLLDIELTNQIKLKEEVSALKEMVEQLQEQLHHKDEEIAALEEGFHNLEGSLMGRLDQHSQHLWTILKDSLSTMEHRLAAISLRLNGLSRKQSVRTQQSHRNKQLLEEYSGSCSQLQVEILRLVGQLEQFRSKAQIERNRKLEDAVRSSEKLKHEKQQLQESLRREMQQSRVLMGQQEEKLKQYEMQLSQYSLQQSMLTPDKGEQGQPQEESLQKQLNSCSKLIDFRSINICSRDMEVQTRPLPQPIEQEQLSQLREYVTEQLGEFSQWMMSVSDSCSRQLKIVSDRLEERSMELVRAVGKKFKISYTSDNILEQTIRFISEFEPERKEAASNYFEVLERLVEELLFSRVNLNLQQQLKTLQPSEKDKILGYRKKIADLQFQLSSKDELAEKLRNQETEIAALKTDIKSKEKKLAYYESEVNEKDNLITQLKSKKQQPVLNLNLSEQSQSLFLIEEDLLDKDFGTTSTESLNELLDQSGICSDELGFTKAQLTRCLRDNTTLKEKLKLARHHLKRIIDLIESHSGGSETNAKIYEAVLSCRSTLC